MKVSELAERAGVAASAVRWYESVGILPELDEMVGDGLITLEKIEVLAYRGRGPA